MSTLEGVCIALLLWFGAARCLVAQGSRLTLRPATAHTDAAFSGISSVRELSDGSLLVAEHGSGLLRRVRWDGQEPETIGRTGGGPTEYRGMGWLYALPDDSTILTDFQGRWLLLAGARIVSSLPAQQGLTLLFGSQPAGFDSAGHVLGTSGAVFGERAPHLRGNADSLDLVLATRATETTSTLRRLRGAGAAGWIVSRSRGSTPGRVISNNPLDAEDQVLLFEDGWIAVASVDPYRVSWRTPDGRWLTGGALPFRAVAVTERERCFAQSRMMGRALPACDPAAFPGWPERVPPFLLQHPQYPTPVLLAAPGGSLVIRRTPTVSAPGQRYDFVDREGRLTGWLELGADETIAGFGTQAVYVISKDQDDLETIRRHPWP